MVKRNILLMLLTLIPSTGITAAREFTFLPSQDQETLGTSQDMVRQETSDFILVISLHQRRGAAYFEVGLQNKSDRRVAFQDRSVTAGASPRDLRIDPYAQAQRSLKRRDFWRRFGAALAAAGNNISAQQAGYSYQSGTYSSTTHASAYGSGGYAYGTANTHGTYSGTTYSPALAAQAQHRANHENARIISRVNEQAAQERMALEAQRPAPFTIIGPNSFGERFVPFKLPRKLKQGETIELVVTANGAPFFFKLTEER